MDYTIYYYIVGIIVIAAVAVIGYLLFKQQQDKNRKEQIHITPIADGWQFYSNPTTGEPPGTIFRITKEKQRFLVAEPGVIIHLNKEASGKTTESVHADTGMSAKFLGLGLDIAVNFKAGEDQTVTFTMDDSVKESTLDVEVNDLVKQSLEKIKFDTTQRYFVIRDTRSTKEIDYELTRSQVDSLGGEAKIKDALQATPTVLNKKDDTKFELKRKFDELMRIMFNAEEIHIKSSGLTLGNGGSELTLKPIKERLEWTDAQ